MQKISTFIMFLLLRQLLHQARKQKHPQKKKKKSIVHLMYLQKWHSVSLHNPSIFDRTVSISKGYKVKTRCYIIWQKPAKKQIKEDQVNFNFNNKRVNSFKFIMFQLLHQLLHQASNCALKVVGILNRLPKI